MNVISTRIKNWHFLLKITEKGEGREAGRELLYYNRFGHEKPGNFAFLCIFLDYNSKGIKTKCKKWQNAKPT